MEAPGLSNDRFWTLKIIKFVCQVTATSGKTIKNDLQKTTCFGTFHRKTKTLGKADELAHHSPLHAALFPRVGAGGRGRSP